MSEVVITECVSRYAQNMRANHIQLVANPASSVFTRMWEKNLCGDME